MKEVTVVGHLFVHIHADKRGACGKIDLYLHRSVPSWLMGKHKLMWRNHAGQSCYQIYTSCGMEDIYLTSVIRPPAR